MTTQATRRTQVSKSHPAVKALVDAAFGAWEYSTKPGLGWLGRTVVVLEADEGWSHTVYADDMTYAAYVRLDADGDVVSTQAFDRPRAYSGTGSVQYNLCRRRDVDGTTSEFGGGVLVLWSRFMSKDMGVELVVPAEGRRSFDQDALAVAVDVVLAGTVPGAKRNRKALAAKVGEALVSCGKMAGLASAVVEARAKLLTVKQETTSALADATSLEEVDTALSRLRRASLAEYTQLVKERGGLVKLLRLYLRLGGSPLDWIGRRLLVRAIWACDPDGGFEICRPGVWWSPIRVTRSQATKREEETTC